MSYPIGTRVGAISHHDAGIVYLFGWGTYEGDFVPEEACGDLAEMLREPGIPNPRIRLDSGQIVYGCECWWGPEETLRKKFAEHEFVDVDIDQVRRTFRDSSSNEGVESPTETAVSESEPKQETETPNPESVVFCEMYWPNEEGGIVELSIQGSAILEKKAESLGMTLEQFVNASLEAALNGRTLGDN